MCQTKDNACKFTDTQVPSGNLGSILQLLFPAFNRVQAESPKVEVILFVQ